MKNKNVKQKLVLAVGATALIATTGFVSVQNQQNNSQTNSSTTSSIPQRDFDTCERQGGGCLLLPTVIVTD